MRVLLVHNAYGRPSGEEVVVNQIAELLKKHGHTVELFLKSSVGLEGDLRRQVAAFWSGLGNPDAVKNFSLAMREFTPDVVHVHNLYPWISPAILPVCRQAGVPVVMSVHNYRLVCPNGLLLSHGELCERCISGREYWCVLRNCENSVTKSVGYALRNFVARKRRWYLDNVTRFAVLSSFQQKKLQSAGVPGSRIAVLPNAVSLPSSARRASPGDVVGFSGRISQEKGVGVFLDAMRELEDLPAGLAGASRDDSELARRAPPNVELLGHLDRDDLHEFYRRLRILVFPSVWYETFGLVIVEAMAHGVPVIAARIGGVPDIVEDGVTGLLFQPGDARELAEKIRYLWERPELCYEMGSAGVQKVHAAYSESAYYDRLQKIYQDAIGSEV